MDKVYSYSLARSKVHNGPYTNFAPIRLGFEPPNVPEGSIKELKEYIHNPWHKIADNPLPSACHVLLAFWSEDMAEWVVGVQQADYAEGIYTHWQHLTTPDSVGS